MTMKQRDTSIFVHLFKGEESCETNIGWLLDFTFSITVFGVINIIQNETLAICQILIVFPSRKSLITVMLQFRIWHIAAAPVVAAAATAEAAAATAAVAAAVLLFIVVAVVVVVGGADADGVSMGRGGPESKKILTIFGSSRISFSVFQCLRFSSA